MATEPHSASYGLMRPHSDNLDTVDNSKET